MDHQHLREKPGLEAETGGLLINHPSLTGEFQVQCETLFQKNKVESDSVNEMLPLRVSGPKFGPPGPHKKPGTVMSS